MRIERAAGDRMNADERQYVRRHHERGQPHGRAGDRREVDLGRNQRADRFDLPRAVAIVEQVGQRARLARRAGVAVGFPDHHQAIESGDRRAPKQDAVHDGKDRRVQPDADGEAHDRDERHPGMRAMETDGVSKVLQDASHDGRSPGRSRGIVERAGQPQPQRTGNRLAPVPEICGRLTVRTRADRIQIVQIRRDIVHERTRQKRAEHSAREPWGATEHPGHRRRVRPPDGPGSNTVLRPVQKASK